MGGQPDREHVSEVLLLTERVGEAHGRVDVDVVVMLGHGEEGVVLGDRVARRLAVVVCVLALVGDDHVEVGYRGRSRVAGQGEALLSRTRILEVSHGLLAEQKNRVWAGSESNRNQQGALHPALTVVRLRSFQSSTVSLHPHSKNPSIRATPFLPTARNGKA